MNNSLHKQVNNSYLNNNKIQFINIKPSKQIKRDNFSSLMKQEYKLKESSDCIASNCKNKKPMSILNLKSNIVNLIPSKKSIHKKDIVSNNEYNKYNNNKDNKDNLLLLKNNNFIKVNNNSNNFINNNNCKNIASNSNRLDSKLIKLSPNNSINNKSNNNNNNNNDQKYFNMSSNSSKTLDDNKNINIINNDLLNTINNNNNNNNENSLNYSNKNYNNNKDNNTNKIIHNKNQILNYLKSSKENKNNVNNFTNQIKYSERILKAINYSQCNNQLYNKLQQLKSISKVSINDLLLNKKKKEANNMNFNNEKDVNENSFILNQQNENKLLLTKKIQYNLKYINNLKNYLLDNTIKPGRLLDSIIDDISYNSLLHNIKDCYINDNKGLNKSNLNNYSASLDEDCDINKELKDLSIIDKRYGSIISKNSSVNNSNIKSPSNNFRNKVVNKEMKLNLKNIIKQNNEYNSTYSKRNRECKKVIFNPDTIRYKKINLKDESNINNSNNTNNNLKTIRIKRKFFSNCFKCF